MNSVTVKFTPLPELLARSAALGLGGVGLWRDSYDGLGVERAARLVTEHDLRVSSVCRAGMFTAPSAAERAARLEDSRRAVEEAAILDAESLVVVCGGVVGRDLHGSRAMVEEGLLALAPYAAAAGVRLAVEPMHPMMIADRSVITSLREAVNLVERLDALGAAGIGVVLDSYHVFWDADLPIQAARLRHRVPLLQISDWSVPIQGQLSSRAMPGDGCIDLAGFLDVGRATGFDGLVEVEILSDRWWEESAVTTMHTAINRMADL